MKKIVDNIIPWNVRYQLRWNEEMFKVVRGIIFLTIVFSLILLSLGTLHFLSTNLF